MRIIATVIILFCVNCNLFCQSIIAIDSATINFVGTQEKPIKQIVKFKNVSTSVLYISDIKTGDGGSYAVRPKGPIMPGKIGEIEFNQDTRQRCGKKTKLIFLDTNLSVEPICIIVSYTITGCKN